MEKLDRARKLQKLDGLRRRMPHMSRNAMAELLKEVAEHGLPELHSRHHMAEAVSMLLDEDTEYGPLLVDLNLPMKNGTTEVHKAVNPLAFMCIAFRQGGGFTREMSSIFRNVSYEKPLQLILYGDEVTPGKEIAHDNKRKVWMVYFGFLELMHVAHKEEAWFPLLCLRTLIVSEVVAGISKVMAELAKLFFGSLVADCSSGGIVLKCPGAQYRIWIKTCMLLQDGAAHKLVWNCKGDCGTRMCLCCTVLAESSGYVDEDGDEVLRASASHESELTFTTDEDVWASVDRLAARHGTCTAGEFRLREQAAGFNHVPEGLLSDIPLREHIKPISNYCHDWMHCLAVSGVINVCIFHFLRVLIATGLVDITRRCTTTFPGGHGPRGSLANLCVISLRRSEEPLTTKPKHSRL
jgi:hypothetical protein